MNIHTPSERFQLTLFIVVFFSSHGYSDPSNERLSLQPKSYLEMGYRSLPWSRDPFYPLRSQFELTGIIVNEKAFIDGKWHSVGEWINQYQINAVRSSKVILKRGDELFSLKLME